MAMALRTHPLLYLQAITALSFAMPPGTTYADCPHVLTGKPSYQAETSLSVPSHSAENVFRRALSEQAGLDFDEAKLFFDCLKDATKRDDKTALSRLVQYPLRIHALDRASTIATPVAFRKAYPLIFNQRVKDAIEAQRFEDVFVSYRGIMIGNGEVWISGIKERGRSKPTIKIISINN